MTTTVRATFCYHPFTRWVLLGAGNDVDATAFSRIVDELLSASEATVACITFEYDGANITAITDLLPGGRQLTPDRVEGVRQIVDRMAQLAEPGLRARWEAL